MTNNHITQVKRYPTAMTIAGLDPSGGAGLLADVKTFSALGVYGMGVATAITIQNTMGVNGVEAVSPHTVYGQATTVMSDIMPQAVKTGMMNDAQTIVAVAQALREYKPKWVVVDPVMVSTSGHALIENDAVSKMKDTLLPLASVVTPNLPEACRLGGVPFSSDINASQLEIIGRNILDFGAKAVLIKGGHRTGNVKSDILFWHNGMTIKKETFAAPTINTINTHGTGCTLSAAIAAFLACGNQLETTIQKAKQYITTALQAGADVQIGHGHGSVNHFFSPLNMIKTDIPQ